MRFSLRQLEVFLATAHYQNISKAADSLAMSQSAASSALKELEQQFDVLLFDRVGKRLQLNEQGRLIRSRAEALLEQAKEVESALMQHQEAGVVKVGATLTIGNYLAVNILGDLLQVHADAQVELSVANTQSIVQQVLNYDIDLGMIEGEIQHSELDIIPWREDDLCVFCAPHHPLAKKTLLSDEDIKNSHWILRESGSGTRQAFDRAMHGILPELNIMLELQHTEAIKRAVGKNLGVGCLSRIALEDAFKRGDLVELPVPQRDFIRTLYFILHKKKHRSAGIERWLAFCQRAS
ncbi:LysR family transcriptional regulator [Bermanella marisrubri]|uniref:Transcriptional regulator n=1 Tax=Bermanella marisrubri TaxID=207949 RepID=Q1N3P0_9GAMM|nr:LysR family transcriptional regulator [Bermanella marisrubri]EAT12834.1 Transcriptional regulator [Oceanobacter sp. RED65] [Bermanella marisrubri]QIZ83155.1 LysR family transcriptional regulator [Bermanella marisrubri]